MSLGRCCASQRVRARGVTLIELMVTVAVASVLAFLAAPSFQSIILNNRLSSYGSDFIASTRLARNEAIKRNAVVQLCRSSDGLTCATTGGWQQGWIVAAGTTVVERRQPLAAEYQFTGNAYTIEFQPTGLGATSAVLSIQSQNAAAASYGCVVISAVGVAKYSKRAVGAPCA